ncbi:MAG: hypothetical protein ACTXOO_01290 [Sodalis sp. (in: enterobacteria)]
MYPIYDFTCCIFDLLEGTIYALCMINFRDNHPDNTSEFF